MGGLLSLPMIKEKRNVIGFYSNLAYVTFDVMKTYGSENFQPRSPRTLKGSGARILPEGTQV